MKAGILGVLMSATVTLIPQHANAIHTNNQNNTINMNKEVKYTVPLESPDCQHVKIPRGDIFLAADIYKPLDFEEGKTYPAIVVSHPGGGVKEQVSGTYARRLSEAGFIDGHALVVDGAFTVH